MEFNSEQQAALSSIERNLLVLAGAGTGKTRTIIGRARHLLASGVAPERIVIMTFTRRAANEIRSRLTTASGGSATKIVAGTFHHFCLRTMSSRRRWFGFDDLTVMDRDDQLQLMKLSRADVTKSKEAIPKAAELLNNYSYARNTNQSPQKYLEKFTDHGPDAIKAMLKVFASYKKRKLNGSYFDYDDILHRFAQVLHEDADVRQKVAGRYEHVLVDEMQDTNPLQWLILQSLAEHANLFCVGDDAQSIYAFRGADFRNVHSFDQRLEDAATVKLEQNYRSTQEILDLANWLLGESGLKYGKKLQAIRGSGEKPHFFEFMDEFEEADWVVNSIMSRQQQGANWAENMILCRTAYVARPVEAQLIERKIPYRFVGGISLLQMAHVKDLLSALRVGVNLRDELAWMRYLTLWPGIGEVTAARMMAQLVKAPDHEAAIEFLRETRRNDRKEISQCVATTVKHRDKPARAVAQLAELLEPLLSSKYDRWDARQKDFDLLEQLATRHKSVDAFLETYTLDPLNATEVSAESDDDLVTLITVHSAKGTEAKHSYVVGAQPGNYPHTRSLGDNDSIEEERRVLYVALTRAQDTLSITRNLSRSYSRVSWNHSVGSHYFFDRLPGHLVRSDMRANSYLNLDSDVIG